MQQQRIYDLINRNRKGMFASRLYDWYMLIIIIASITPLMFIDDYPIFKVIEIVTVIAFIIDYLLRWSTANLQLKRGLLSYILYPLSFYPDGNHRFAFDFTRFQSHKSGIQVVATDKTA